MKMYDLVKVTERHNKHFYSAIGIIDKIDKDIGGKPLYRLIFVGEYHNKVAKTSAPYFYKEELEGI